MAKEKKRKSRNRLAGSFDTLKPLLLEDIYKLGTENDPCFGKLYDPKAPECQRCGDNEICAITFGQNNHKLRDKAEKNMAFLDLEEKEIDTMSNSKKAKKLIRRLINNHKSISVEAVKQQVMSGLDISEKVFEKILKKIMATTSKFKLSNGILKLK